jgi:hypothetical protein
MQVIKAVDPSISTHKGKEQMTTEKFDELIINSQEFWEGSCTSLMIEQIKNSQEDQISFTNYQVTNITKSYIMSNVHCHIVISDYN